jgi:hypothetical protein
MARVIRLAVVAQNIVLFEQSDLCKCPLPAFGLDMSPLGSTTQPLLAAFHCLVNGTHLHNGLGLRQWQVREWIAEI